MYNIRYTHRWASSQVCELQVWEKSYKRSLGTKKCLKDEKPEKNRCNAFICSDVPVNKLHPWLRALENFWQELWLVQRCLWYLCLNKCMLQWSHNCGYVAGTTGLLQFTTGNTGCYFRQVKTWWDFPAMNCFYPAAIIMHFALMGSTSDKLKLFFWLCLWEQAPL